MKKVWYVDLVDDNKSYLCKYNQLKIKSPPNASGRAFKILLACLKMEAHFYT